MATSSSNNYTQIGIAGDWHANLSWALKKLDYFAKKNIQHILHLGDFGFWAGSEGKEYVEQINKKLIEHNQYLYITLGNHEDYNLVNKYYTTPSIDGFLSNPRFERILVAPRVHDWTWNNTHFLSVGGANSIDKQWRTSNVSWWSQEQISDADVETAQQITNVDLMVAHEVPLGVDVFGDSPKENWNASALHYAQQSSAQMRKIVDKVKPKLFFHGHYHLFANLRTPLTDPEYNDYCLYSVCLDMDDKPHNIAIYSTENHGFIIP